ncbi:N5-carboxyaminoimidazole ribonucleotide mutase [Tepidibacillus decaturensis]|uniref:N5-carboxyaminoimidazole ribonucleotide mutase n=2 Tax=Bacillaceae TaxID=186817 RepID=A0A135L0Y3_9BACI|nr:N5-carboxyaminoimidazole ribonucleotide mutase [Tepidibacillus decaturensis]
MQMSKVLIVMGSDSDLPIMEGAMKALKQIDIPYEVMISSAHRTPEQTAKIAKEAEKNGFSVIIAGAGMAAHLPGVIAAYSTLPVIGVPINGSALNGLDALYAIVQMPKGLPVATVAINGAYNAGILAAQIIGVFDQKVANELKNLRKIMAEEVELKNKKLQENLPKS